MEKVTGTGGVFFRARSPKELGEWYRDHLGVDLVPEKYEVLPWQQQAGPQRLRRFQTIRATSATQASSG